MASKFKWRFIIHMTDDEIITFDNPTRIESDDNILWYKLKDGSTITIKKELIKYIERRNMG